MPEHQTLPGTVNHGVDFDEIEIHHSEEGVIKSDHCHFCRPHDPVENPVTIVVLLREGFGDLVVVGACDIHRLALAERLPDLYKI